MDLFTTFFLAFALAMDAFAVALAAGASLGRANKRQIFRLSFHFGLFQFMMPIIGWSVGYQVELIFSFIDHWIAFGLLCFIGGKMIYESRSAAHLSSKRDMTKGASLVSLSIATSIDALAVGFSLAVMNVSIIQPSIIIGVVAGIITIIGIRIGEKFSLKLGKKMEFAGGAVLLLIGIKIVLEHLEILK